MYFDMIASATAQIAIMITARPKYTEELRRCPASSVGKTALVSKRSNPAARPATAPPSEAAAVQRGWIPPASGCVSMTEKEKGQTSYI